MKSIIAHKPSLTARVVISLVLQIALIALLRQPHQDSTIFNLGILVIAVLAMVPLCVRIACLRDRTALILGLVGLFPQFVILATVLHLMGWSGLFDWLLRLFDNRAAYR
jgi:hypothetical protein